MSYQISLNTPIQSIFWPSENSFMKKSLLILAGVLLLSIASQLSIPLKPVPLTFQSATVVLIGMMFGARYGTYIVGTYLVAGVCGLPVFEGFASGLTKFFGPTCGYLIGFLPAAFISGYLSQNGWSRSIFTSFITACLGVSIIFLSGIMVLSQFIGFANAIAFGLAPFILSELIKLAAVSFIVPRCWKNM